MKLKKNILLVDDDKITHFINERMIDSMGLAKNVHKAFNGLEALQILQNYCNDIIEKLDVILLDLHMPVMDGFEFIRVFQQMEIPNKDMATIVILTSSIDSADMKKALSLGIKRCITKPLTEEDVKIVFGI